MSDINYLPSRYQASFRRAAAASAAVRNLMLLYDPNYITVFDNFLGDVIADQYPAAATNGTSAAVTVATSQLILTTGTDDNGYAGQGYGLFWKGDNGIYLESAQSVNSVANVKFEVGLTDATGDAGAVNSKASPSGTADDFCVLILDTDDNAEWDIISELDNGGPVANAEDVFTAVGGTIFTTEFKMQNDLVAVYVNGQNVGSGSCQGGDLMTPWFFTQARAVSDSKTGNIEYFFCTGPSGLALP